MINNNRAHAGFTLIELLLAMTFLASILIFATTTLVQTLAVYNKGVAYKQINQTGRQLTDDISQVANGGFGSVTTESTTNAGYACISDGSNTRAYFWDTPGVAAGGGNGIFTVAGAPITIIRSNPTVKVDRNLWCKLPASTDTDISLNVTAIASDQVGVVASSVSSPDQGLNPGLTRLSFVLGTINASSSMNPSQIGGVWQCPGGSLGNFCAVGTFETTLYSPNGQ